MTLLALGLALFIAGHMVRRFAPAAWAGLIDRYGLAGARAVTGTVVGIGTILIVIGYRGADFVPVYDPPAWTIHLNNLMMPVAVFIFGMSMSKGRSRAWLRHPMYTATAVWAAAHLLVNGDLASLVMFGVLGLWALVSIPVVSAIEGPWQRPAPGPLSGDIRLVVITVLAFAAITTVHTWLGYWPFPR